MRTFHLKEFFVRFYLLQLRISFENNHFPKLSIKFFFFTSALVVQFPFQKKKTPNVDIKSSINECKCTSLSVSGSRVTKLSGKTPSLPLTSPLHQPGSPVS